MNIFSSCLKFVGTVIFAICISGCIDSNNERSANPSNLSVKVVTNADQSEVGANDATTPFFVENSVGYEIAPSTSIFRIIEKETSVSMLLRFLQSEDVFEVRYTIDRLSEINTDESRQVLMDLWAQVEPYKSDPFYPVFENPITSTRLSHAVLKIDPEISQARSYLWSQVESRNSVVRWDVAKAIGEVGGEKFVSIMSKLGADRDIDVAYAAISSLEERSMSGDNATELLQILNSIVNQSPHNEIVEYASALISRNLEKKQEKEKGVKAEMF